MEQSESSSYPNNDVLKPMRLGSGSGSGQDPIEFKDAIKRSVLVVEDDSFLRDLLAVALERNGFVVETAASAADAKRVFNRGDHDAVMLDVSLGPGLDGFDLAQILRSQSPNVAVVFLTDLPDSRFAGKEPGELLPGIVYLRKSSLNDTQSLVVALDSALRGIDMNKYRQDQEPDRPLGKLTRKQLAVLGLAARGLSNAQIAAERGVNVKAVEDTIARASNTLAMGHPEGANVRVTAVRRYLEATGGKFPMASDNQ
jgi:DNA-binding NarL/FixJ family response regulator